MQKNKLARLPLLLILPALLFALFGSDALSQDGPPKKDKGKPKFTNRLAKETSPYLRLHAHNPVDWYPWGDEAFAKAKKEGKMIFLSIGYSSCYWCHVMARDSFENEEVAGLLNKWFVCIKVDREERPDIDQIYMTALEVMGQNGGWPLSMFLTTDGRPVIGGTYWPREDRTVQGKVLKGFKSLVTAVHDIATEKPQDVDKQATKIADATAALLAAPKLVLAAAPDRDTVKGCLDGLRDSFDTEYGGFGSFFKGFKGPKFPTPCRLALLLHEGERAKSKEQTGMVTLTLDKMALGGIYDQLGGGFHRYSTERTWTVPHFEKMLYDNAQLLEVYAAAYQLTKKPLYKRVLLETIAYLQREMMSPEGAFYSSQDAETEEEEGRSYVWTQAELEKALPKAEDLQLIRKVYGADGEPNFEKKFFILKLARPLAETAKEMKLTEAELLARLEPLKQQLFKARSQREQPLLNTVSLTSWSGLTVAGVARAGKALDDPKVIATAVKAADFLLSKQVTKDGRLLHTYGAAPGEKPRAAVPGFLEDYAGLVHGLLALHDVTGAKHWLDEAEKLTKTMITHHGDKDSGGYYFTAHDAQKLFARSKDSYDGAMPSGNSLALLNLVRLWTKTGDAFYQKQAERGFETFTKALDDQPTGLTTMTLALSLYLDQQDKKDKQAPDGEIKQPPKKPDPVKVEAKAGKLGDNGEQTITVTLNIDKGWHIYANPVGNEDLEGADTTVKIAGKGLSKVVKITYPPGKEESSVLGKYKAYTTQAVVTAVVQRVQADTEALEVSVQYQACDDKQCLLPKTVKLKVPAEGKTPEDKRGTEVEGLMASGQVKKHKPQNEPPYVEVEFQLKNVSDKPITICYHISTNPVFAKWIGPDGKVLQLRKYPNLGFLTLRALSKKNFITIPPGGVQTLCPAGLNGKMIFQSDAEPDRLGHVVACGKHRLSISYSNSEDGKRFGVENVWTGTVTAKEVVFELP